MCQKIYLLKTSDEKQPNENRVNAQTSKALEKIFNYGLVLGQIFVPSLLFYILSKYFPMKNQPRPQRIFSVKEEGKKEVLKIALGTRLMKNQILKKVFARYSLMFLYCSISYCQNSLNYPPWR